MRSVTVLLVACALAAMACGKVKESPPDVVTPEPETGLPAHLVFPEAGRVEALLRAAGVPYELRNDLVGEFPEGCVWLAVYASVEPEVILETYAFRDWDGAINYGKERAQEFDAGDVLREVQTVHNGPLLLVAYYDPAEEARAKADTITKFISAFAGEE